VILLLFVLLTILLAALALLIEPVWRRFIGRARRRPAPRHEPGRNRLAELKEKRRSGEITEDEYQTGVRALGRTASADLRDRFDARGKRRLRRGR